MTSDGQNFTGCNSDYEIASPEVRTEMDKLSKEMDAISEIMKSVAESIPQEVSDGTDKPGWKFGSFKISRINDPALCTVGHEYTLDEIKAIRLSGIYKQTAKKGSDPAVGFCSTVPLSFIGKVNPGQAINIDKSIPAEWKPEEVEAMARESFIALQQLVKEFYESE